MSLAILMLQTAQSAKSSTGDTLRIIGILFIIVGLILAIIMRGNSFFLFVAGFGLLLVIIGVSFMGG